MRKLRYLASRIVFTLVINFSLYLRHLLYVFLFKSIQKLDFRYLIQLHFWQVIWLVNCLNNCFSSIITKSFKTLFTMVAFMTTNSVDSNIVACYQVLYAISFGNHILKMKSIVTNANYNWFYDYLVLLWAKLQTFFSKCA